MTAVRDQNIPDPGIENIQRLQLMRYTVVNLIDNRNFEELIQGCFVRVLLELRAVTSSTNAGTDSYYIAMIKGAQKGPSYSGFSWDGLSTEWHVIIDLPPCFRSAPNSNVIQLNSISNSPVRPAEYQQWVSMTRESGQHFITPAQIDLRAEMLQEVLTTYNLHNGQSRRRRQPNLAEMSEADRLKLQQRDQTIAVMKEHADQEIRREYMLFPTLEQLTSLNKDELQELLRRGQELQSHLRMVLTQRSKCFLCRNHNATVVGYPCRHQVMCLPCSGRTQTCPLPTCGQFLADKFEPFCTA